MQAERIAPGYTTDVLQHPSSFMYHCYEGEGKTEVTSNGQTTMLNWRNRDTFVVPASAQIRHYNLSATEPAYLVAANDRPFLKNLALCRIRDEL